MNRFTFPLFAFLSFFQSLNAQVDTVPPVVVCKPALDIPVNIPCFATVWPSDFIVSATDDSSLPVQTGIRKSCTGDGFPENGSYLIFTAAEWGTARVECWARDAAGNTGSCTMTIFVSDAAGSCDPSYTIRTAMPSGSGIQNAMIDVAGANCWGDSLKSLYETWLDGAITGFGFISLPGYNTGVTPEKNVNPLNGVTTNDLLLIQKHILGIQSFDSPYKLIAADANQDGKVTSFDILTLRKLMLGITNELPNGKSWRFIPADYAFPNPANPFQPPFPERIDIPNTADPVPTEFHFIGVKIGDVDYSADPNQ